MLTPAILKAALLFMLRLFIRSNFYHLTVNFIQSDLQQYQQHFKSKHSTKARAQFSKTVWCIDLITQQMHLKKHLQASSIAQAILMCVVQCPSLTTSRNCWPAEERDTSWHIYSLADTMIYCSNAEESVTCQTQHTVHK